MAESSVGMNLKNSIRSAVRKIEDYSIYTSVEWSFRKDEQETDGKIKVHDQWC